MNICTLNKIAACGTARFDAAKYTVTEDLSTATGVMVRSAAMHDMDLPDSLLAIARAGAGVNNIPVDKCSETGVVVFNTPGANANAVKELEKQKGRSICAQDRVFFAQMRVGEGTLLLSTLRAFDDPAGEYLLRSLLETFR